MVTGASQGIGLACAEVFSDAGAKVALASRNAERLRQLAAEFAGRGGEAMAVTMDVGDSAAVKAGVDAVIAAWAKIDILVNNAGLTRDNLLMRMKLEDWEAVLKVNLGGAYHCIRAVLPFMVKQRYGRIISIASVVAQVGNPGQANYIASKAGLLGLTKAVAAEVASRNITVNAVAPGFIDTAMTQKLSDTLRQKILGAIPAGRVGTGREVALAVRFLASDDAAYITGHCLNVNGGMHMA